MIVGARWLAALLLFAIPAIGLAGELRGTGNLGLVIERATGSVLIVDTGARQTIGRVEGLGDLSHASVVFLQLALRLSVRARWRVNQDRSADGVDCRARRPGRNSIGGAISDDGELIAVSNYEPAGSASTPKRWRWSRTFQPRAPTARPRRPWALSICRLPLCLCALQRRRDLDRRPLQGRNPGDHPAHRGRQIAL